MTPHEVRARCAELGTPIVQSTLANYKAAGLIFPPVVQSLGRFPMRFIRRSVCPGATSVFRSIRSLCFGLSGLPAKKSIPTDCRSICTLAAGHCYGASFSI